MSCVRVLVVLLLVVQAVRCNEKVPYSMEEYPNPRTDFDKCGRGKESWVCDPGKYLNASDGDRLDNMVQFMKDAETCLCDDTNECFGDYRHEVLIAIVPRIKYSNGGFPDNYADQKLATKEFAEYLRDDAWKSQGKQCRMRVFIVFDMHTKVVWTATNYYALKLISDRRAKEVGLDAKTEFLNKGKTFEGMESMIFQYRNFLFEADKFMPDDPKGDRGGNKGDKGPKYRPEPEGVPWWKPFTGVLSTLLLIILIVVVCYCVCRNVDCMAPGRPGGIWFPSGGGPTFGVAACGGGGWRGGGGCGGGGCGGGGWKGGGGCGGGGGFGGGGDDGGGGDYGGGGDDGGGGGGGGCGGGGGSACGADGDNAKCGGGGGG